MLKYAFPRMELLNTYKVRMCVTKGDKPDFTFERDIHVKKLKGERVGPGNRGKSE